MLKKILIGAAAILAVLAVAIATRPDTFTVTRSRTLDAPPAAVYAQVADFHRWAAWSPWERLDPAMQKTFGPNSYAWKGNKEVGEGRMTVTGATPDSRIDIKLEFFKPFASESDTSFTFAPAGQGTQVTWTMTGKHNFMSKAMCLVMDMDKMIGGDFERGLAGLAGAAVAQK